MDPIDGVSPTGKPAPVAGRGAASGRGFRVAEDAPAAAPAGTSEAESVAKTSLAGLLALQEEAGGGAARDREARRRGRDLLGELIALQRELLAGAPGAARLARLAGLAEAVPEAADPRLREAVTAIVVRARVEAARYRAG
jgi:Class II flagellar assembly regulator